MATVSDRARPDRARRRGAGWLIATLLCASAAHAQAPGSMAQHHWEQQGRNAGYVSAEQAAARQAAAEAVAQRDAGVRHDQSRDWWGAIAVDVDDGSWSVRINGQGDDATMRAALAQCDGTCWPVATFANTCVAPAYGAAGGLFFGDGDTPARAAGAASARCEAAGQGACRAEVEQAACTGWKYAYSRVERLQERLNLVALGRVAKPRFEFFADAEDFIATPLQARGSGVAAAVPEGMRGAVKVAQAWIAVAARRSDAREFAMRIGPTRDAAQASAVRECGAADCEPLLALTSGQCAAVALAPVAGVGRAYHAVAASQADAEEQAVLACIEDGRDNCPTVFRHCQ
ncbi:DUF4189 domain-containing protein [Luteimonas sp. XNQY3]|nr:DUF4189 domain-containing protein [Luteimonas sp. XNQY3]MCD9006968.1 DUF4189 domain-containing protein [Luteimonas sp. XNQY3]